MHAYGFLAPPKDPKAPALVVGVWMGNSDNSPDTDTLSLGSSAPLFEYRGAMPVSGSHNIPSLGGTPSEAVRNLKAMVDGSAFGRIAAVASRAGSRP